MNLALWLERAGHAHPAAPAIALGAKVHADYATLAGKAARIAGAMRAAGMKPGDRVAVVAKNHPDYIAILYGLWHAGLAAVPANARLHVLQPSALPTCKRPPPVHCRNRDI